jgi:hypothetical protein
MLKRSERDVRFNFLQLVSVQQTAMRSVQRDTGYELEAVRVKWSAIHTILSEDNIQMYRETGMVVTHFTRFKF